MYDEFEREYIKYLIEEVSVVPLENIEINLISMTIRLVLNEESKVPRWLAYILEQNNKVKIKDVVDPREMVGRLAYYAFREKEGSPLSIIEKDLLFRVKEYISQIDEKTREKITDALRNFVRFRIPKIIRRALTTGQEKDLLLWEEVLSRHIKRLSKEWLETLIEMDIRDILEQF